MTKNVFRKGLVIGIIVLFVGASVVPSISGTYDFNTTGHIKNLNIINRPPDEEWNRTFGGNNNSIGIYVQQTNDGGYIMTGVVNNSNEDNGDAWLIKTDSNGIEEWNCAYGGIDFEAGLTVHQSIDGGYIVSGSTGSYGLGDADFWLFKTDSNGNEIWNKTYGGMGYDISWMSCQTTDGGYMIIGQVDTLSENEIDIGVVKTDEDGNEIWSKTYGGQYFDVGRGVHETPDGGYLIVGNTMLDYDRTGEIIPAVWLIKTDSNGDVLWDKTYGDSTTLVSSMSIQLTADDGYIITGAVVENISKLNSDIWLLKTDAIGNIQWNKSFGGFKNDSGFSVIQTNDGGYVITGTENSDFLPWNLSTIGDAFLIKTDSNGNKQWNKTFGGSGGDTGWTVQQTNDNGYIIVGYTDSYNEDGFHAWLIKIEGDNQPPTAPEIDGETNGKVGTGYDYDFTNCVDPNGDDMTYHVKWDDGGVDEGFVASGGAFTLTHSWDAKGDYTIKAKLIDEYGAESDWAELEVSMPRNRLFPNTFFLRLLERYPNLFPIIRHLLIL